ncbi:MAG: hypothetical protein IJY36_03215 [Coprobacter sp.]|nr:hypothetical protein [Coprobacter sp.]
MKKYLFIAGIFSILLSCTQSVNDNHESEALLDLSGMGLSMTTHVSTKSDTILARSVSIENYRYVTDMTMEEAVAAGVTAKEYESFIADMKGVNQSIEDCLQKGGTVIFADGTEITGQK